MDKKSNWWVAAGGIVLAAASVYVVWKKTKQQRGDRPPANAPQLDLENPGDQSDFPAAPSGAQELG